MLIFSRAIKFLNKPFPQEETKTGALKVIVAISVFVFLFLYIFQPFDVGTIKDNNLLICLGFGMITFVTSIIYEFLIVPLLRFKGEGITFTYWRWIIYFIGVMLCISIVNYVFVRLVIIGDFTWQFLPYMIRGVFAIGIFPILVTGGLAVLQQEKKYQSISEEINKKGSALMTSQHNENHSIYDIPASRIRYIEALQNYVKIGYVNAGGDFMTKTERATLKQISDQVKGSPIVTSHRSFLVNRSFITSTSGNAQGLLLTLSDCEKPIPVSRSYVSVFRKN